MAEQAPPIFKVTMRVADDPDGVYDQDAIEYEGKLWLVPEWSDSPVLGYRIPTRIISMETLNYQRWETLGIVEYVIDDPMPIAVLEGRAPQEVMARYVVIDMPDLRYPLPSSRMN
ncbi:MAG: hypothetical protein NW206_06130 [Hyphomonadaceae bacterium]|nr:hypothetical protein [Hyphomonadaceae bacterium]